MKMANEKKLSEITEGPGIPEQDLTDAQAAGAEIVGWDPDRIAQFLTGQITLGELEGIPKTAQHEMAEVGYQNLQEGKLDVALQIFEGLLALDPYDAYFHAAVGTALQQKGLLDQAEAAYSRGLEINPFAIATLVQRAEVRVMQSNLGGAAQDLAAAIKEDPAGKDPAGVQARVMANAVRQQLMQLESSKE